MVTQEELQLTDTVILYDRDFGVSIFQNFRGYDSLRDDAEWLLERTSRKSRGFLIRVVIKNGKRGIWIGEYTQETKQIGRQEFIFGDSAETVSKMISDHVNRKISEENILEKIKIENLRKHLNSKIIRDFKYYYCPSYHFLYECPYVDKIYSELTEKYGKGKKIPYSLVAEEIELIETCEDVIVCPLSVSNLFERILNLNRAFKTRKLGEIKFITPDFIKIL
ncbi:TPA: hypothetical protein EYP75_04760 [Candidatus Bathyarchaeota archaeon]|nr:hypothetical protein [Candidatus Bathyarchaeota archaeon]